MIVASASAIVITAKDHWRGTSGDSMKGRREKKGKKNTKMRLGAKRNILIVLVCGVRL